MKKRFLLIISSLVLGVALLVTPFSINSKKAITAKAEGSLSWTQLSVDYSGATVHLLSDYYDLLNEYSLSGTFRLQFSTSASYLGISVSSGYLSIYTEYMDQKTFYYSNDPMDSWHVYDFEGKPNYFVMPDFGSLTSVDYSSGMYSNQDILDIFNAFCPLRSLGSSSPTNPPSTGDRNWADYYDGMARGWDDCSDYLSSIYDSRIADLRSEYEARIALLNSEYAAEYESRIALLDSEHAAELEQVRISAYEDGVRYAYENGDYSSFYDEWYAQGYSDAVSEGGTTGTNWLFQFLAGFSNILNMEIFPNIKLIYLIGLPVVLGALFLIFKLIK